MTFAYSNNGLSFRSVDDGYKAKTGEVLFPDYATSAELAAAFPTYPAEKSKGEILAQIAALEAKQTDRRVREAALGTDNGWLASLETQIKALRDQLK